VTKVTNEMICSRLVSQILTELRRIAVDGIKLIVDARFQRAFIIDAIRSFFRFASITFKSIGKDDRNGERQHLKLTFKTFFLVADSAGN
jgi:hypothetical protein